MLALIASLVAWALFDDLVDEIGACAVLVADKAAALQVLDCMRIFVFVFVCVFAIAELL